jgi:hypothetical protein
MRRGVQMSDQLTLKIEDLHHDFAEQLAWANQAKIENVHSVAQLDQSAEGVEKLREVMEGAAKWDFIRSEAERSARKLAKVGEAVVQQRGQANACMAYLDKILEKSEDPRTVEEVDMLRSFFVQTIQETKQQFDACMQAGRDIEALCKELSEEIKTFTKDAVVRAVTLNHDETLEIIEWATTGANVVLSISDVANPEPISSYAVWGIRVLINGIGTLAREITVAVRQRERTLEDALKELQPLDIAKGKVKDTKLIISWALEPLTLIKGVGPIVKAVVLGGVSAVLNAPIQAAEAKIKEAEAKKLAKTEAEAETKQILEAFGESLKKTLSDTVQESLKTAVNQVKELVDDGKSPEEFMANMATWIMGSLLESVLAKIVDPAQAVTASDISSFAENLARSYSDTFAKDYLKDEDREKLANIGQGTKVLIFDEERVKTKNQEFLKAMAKGEERSVYVGQSPVLKGEVALLVNGSGHRDEDLNYVLSLSGNVQGTVKMIDKGGAFSAGELGFDSVPADLVRKYFKYTEISNKKLRFG